MAKSAAQIELRRMLSDVSHMSQHVPINTCNNDYDSDEPEEEIASVCKRNFVKTFWYSNVEEQFELLRSSSVKDDRGELIRTVYKVNQTMDYIYSNEIQIPLPAVSIKPEREYQSKLRIAWTPNPGVNSIVETEFCVGDIVINRLDTGAIDDYMKWGVPHANNDLRDYSIGDIASLTSWNKNLPAKICIFTIPFCYTYSGGSAFPLYLLNSQTQITHSLTTWSSPIQELLRIEIQVELDGVKVWKPVEKKQNYLRLINHGKIHSPIFIGEYGMMTEDEKEETYKDSIIAIPIHSMITIKNDNLVKYGSSDPIKLKTDDPVIAMFWKAVNVDAERRNNRTNHTTNPDDIRLGYAPITSCGFRYGETSKFRRIDEQMRSINNLKVFPNVPTVNGYNAFAFSRNPFGVRGHSGVIFSNDPVCTLFCNYTDPNNIHSINSIDENGDKSPDDIIIEILNGMGHNVATSDSESASSSTSEFGADEFQTTSSLRHSECKFRTEVRLLLWKELQFIKIGDSKIYDFEYV